MQPQTITIEQPLITPTVPAGDEARVTAILDGIQQHMGFIPDGLRLYTLSPPLLETFVGSVAYFNGGSRLAPHFSPPFVARRFKGAAWRAFATEGRRQA